MEITKCPSTDNEDKQNGACMYDALFLSLKKEGNPALYDSMGEPEGR